MLDLQADQRFTPLAPTTFIVNGKPVSIDVYPIPELTEHQLMHVYEQVGGVAIGAKLFVLSGGRSEYLTDAIRCTRYGQFIADHPSVIETIQEVIMELSSNELDNLVTAVPVVLDLLTESQAEQVGAILAETGNILCVRLIKDVNPEWAEWMFNNKVSRELLPFLTQTTDPKTMVKISTIDWDMFRQVLRNIDPMTQLSVLMTAMATNMERTDSLRCKSVLERISSECEAPWNEYKHCVRHFDRVLGPPEQGLSLWTDEILTQTERAATPTIQRVPESGQGVGRRQTTGYL